MGWQPDDTHTVGLVGQQQNLHLQCGPECPCKRGRNTAGELWDWPRRSWTY